MMVYKWRKRAVSTKKREHKSQKGGALAQKKVRTVDKIAEGLSVFLSRPSPTFCHSLWKVGQPSLIRDYKRGRL